MKYLCLAYYDVPSYEALTREQKSALFPQCKPHDDALRATKKLVVSASLGASARTARTRAGKVSITDGPYVETKEQIGGLFVIEADDFEEAMEVAAKHPAARIGEELGWVVEVRPIDMWLEPEP
jgi:hypothetical protein